MLDGHIHIHNQPFSLSLINDMIKIAVEKGIDELYILDHTSKFFEFDFLYSNLKDKYTLAFYERKKKAQVPLQNYLDFIIEVKKHEWPIKLNFGLEVCYFKEHEEELKKFLKSLEPFKFDFLVGSVHFTDGMCVDLCEEIFLETDVDVFYDHYFRDLHDIIKSQMFDVIAHPDLIKLFNHYPSYSLIPYYEDLAKEFKKYNQRTENNSGLIRHGYPYPGMAKELIEILKKYDVKFHKSSDAHIYTDIGRVFDQLEDNL